MGLFPMVSWCFSGTFPHHFQLFEQFLSHVVKDFHSWGVKSHEFTIFTHSNIRSNYIILLILVFVAEISNEMPQNPTAKVLFYVPNGLSRCRWNILRFILKCFWRMGLKLHQKNLVWFGDLGVQTSGFSSHSHSNSSWSIQKIRLQSWKRVWVEAKFIGDFLNHRASPCKNHPF